MRSRFEELLDLWELCGRRFDPWQSLSLDAILSVDHRGFWAATEFGELVSRQQGKGEILTAYDIGHLYLWPRGDDEPKTILHTAHEFRTVNDAFLRTRRIILRTPALRALLKGGGVESAHGVSGVHTAMGQKGFELENGNRLLFASRTGGAGVGLVIDVLDVDEAQQSPSETMDALLFTQDAVPNSQALFTGTVPMDHQDGEYFEGVRDRGRNNAPHPRTGWAEFSPKGSDDPDLAETLDIDDPQVWVESCPGLGIRMTVEDLLDRIERMRKTNPEALRRQRFSIWPNRRPDVETSRSDLDLRKWADGADGVRLAAPGVVLAVSLGRGGGYSSICGAQAIGDGCIRIEHLATDRGTLWVPQRLKELAEQYRSPLVVLDERNCAPIISDLQRAAVKFLPMTTTEVGAAFELLIESVNAGDVRNAGQEELDLSFRFAQPRAMGRSGLSTWEQGELSEPVTLAQAATLALWGVKRLAAKADGRKPPPSLPAVLEDSSDLDSGHHLQSRDSGIFTIGF